MSRINEPEEVLKQYLRIASSYTMPIFWGSIEGGVCANGSAFVLDTGSRKMVVTAAHVYRSYLQSKKEGKAPICQLKTIHYDLEEHIISVPVSNDVDIATFKVSERELSLLEANILRGSNSAWPPPRPVEGNMVVVSGFPGVERAQKQQDYFCFGYYSFNTPINTVSDRHFGCSFEREFWVDTLGKGFPPENYDMGGISGAPAVALIKSEKEIVSWRLAGIVYEAVATEMLGEIMFAHHADLIEADGTVKTNV